MAILHTNDLHARLMPLADGRGGFAYLAATIRRERANCGHLLALAEPPESWRAIRRRMDRQPESPEVRPPRSFYPRQFGRRFIGGHVARGLVGR